MTTNHSADTAQNFPAVLTLDDFEAVVAARDAGKALWPLALDRNELVSEIEDETDLAESLRTITEFHAHVRRLAAFTEQALQRLADIAGDVVASSRTAEV
jgi:hypothetical protein